MSDQDLHRGAKIGTRIAHLVTQAIVATHHKLIDTKHKLAVMIFNTVTNEISDEVDMTLGPLLKTMAEAYENGGAVEGMMQFMAHGRGQFKAIVGSSATAQSILWALGTVISNELAPVSYTLIAANPRLTPDPASIAQMVATGHISEADGTYGIAEMGFSGKWAKGWIESAKQWPSASDLTDWLNRKLISRSDYHALMQSAGYSPTIASFYDSAAFVEVSWQDAALAYLRGAISRDILGIIADKQGVGSEDVDIYLETIGEPPGTMEMLEGYRRGFINQETLQRGILQSRTRNEWVPLIEQLRYSPISTADAVNAVVQGHIAYNDGERLADQNGLEPGQFDTLYQTAGAPLSRTELNDLYNRGVVGSDIVEQGLRESRLKNKYVADAFELRRRLLEPRSLGEAVLNGAMTHETAIAKAMQNGYNAEDAAYLVSSAGNRKMQTYRNALVAQIEDMYSEGGMSHAAALEQIKSLGHTDAEGQMMLKTADFKREQRTFNTAVGVVRSKLVGHHIDRGTASAMLDGMGVVATQRDFFLGFWELEAAANVRSLTEAQIAKAVKDQIITADDAAERLIRMGYSADDATLLLAMI